MIKEVEVFTDMIATNNDLEKNTPDAARIILTLELIDKILKLHKALILADADSIHKKDNTPQYLSEYEDGEKKFKWLKIDYEPYSEKLACEKLIVYRSAFIWIANINECTTEFETEAINITALREIRHIMTLPKDELPTLIGLSLSSEISKNLLEKRLKEA